MSQPDARTDASHRLVPMAGRDTDEPHRVASSLELLFDLTFVVAFGFAGNEFAHAVAEGHAGAGLLGFGFAMFAIVWAWINFTWFASAFETDDWVYRLVTMVQMVGVLILALGLPPMFDSLVHGAHMDNRVMVLGYVVMRVAMVAQWLRAAREAPAYRTTCRAYAAAISVAQVGWIALLVVRTTALEYLLGAVAMVLVEIVAPIIAERRTPTPWHAHHVAERFGLLAIITLGEGIVGAAAALSAVVRVDGWTWETAAIGLVGVGITFALWWCYFVLPSAEVLHAYRNAKAFVWGYGHIVLFAALAAVGAGLHVTALQVESVDEEHPVSVATAVLAVAVPVGVVILGILLLFTWLAGEAEVFHLYLAVGTALCLAAAVLLAASGTALVPCLLLVLLAPVVMVVGYERVGHAHTATVVDRVRHSDIS